MRNLLPTKRKVAGSTPATFRLSAKHKEWLAGYLFVLPDCIGLLLFIGLPMILALIVSFYSVDGFGSFSFVGIQNYQKMMTDPLFWTAFKVTVLFAVLLVPALYGAGLGLALLVQKTNNFNAAMRSMFFAPQLVSLVVIGLVWKLMLVDKIGILTRFAEVIGIESASFLGNPNTALITITVIAVWFLMGFYMLIFLGGLQDIPKEYYEAAKLDGAGSVSRFWFITLPLLRPTSFFVLTVSAVTATAGAQAFDLVYVMTRGGPANATLLLITYIYQQAFQYSHFGYASAMATLLVALLMTISMVFFVLTGGGRFQNE